MTKEYLQVLFNLEDQVESMRHNIAMLRTQRGALPFQRDEFKARIIRRLDHINFVIETLKNEGIFDSE